MSKKRSSCYLFFCSDVLPRRHLVHRPEVADLLVPRSRQDRARALPRNQRRIARDLRRRKSGPGLPLRCETTKKAPLLRSLRREDPARLRRWRLILVRLFPKILFESYFAATTKRKSSTGLAPADAEEKKLRKRSPTPKAASPAPAAVDPTAKAPVVIESERMQVSSLYLEMSMPKEKCLVRQIGKLTDSRGQMVLPQVDES